MNPSSPDSKSPALHHIQHSAYRCRDAEQTRWFYEDVLGLPMVSALSLERTEANGEDVGFMHIFFGLGDGNQIAFFDEPAHAQEAQFAKRHGFDLHIAFEVTDRATLEGWMSRLAEHGVETQIIDHGFLYSLYFYDPNGIRLELTVKSEDYERHMALEAVEAHDSVRRWSARTRPVKTRRLGQPNIDARQVPSPDLPEL